MMSDYVSAILMPWVLRRTQTEAPGVVIELVANSQPWSALDRGEADFLIIPQNFVRREHPSETLFEDDFVCVCWQGNQLIMGSEGKAFPVAALEPIARLPGVRLIGLQKNAGSEQLDHLPPGMVVERYDFDTGPDAFLDTAAIMMNCDLVITADTAPAHLAGALGVPAWVALKHVPDWRWFMERSDCPWYPSLRLFRQPAMGDWAGVFAAMRAALTSRKS